MSTCPTCGADFRAPLNYLNKPCCANARDAENAKRGAVLAINAPLNPREGQPFYDESSKALLVFRQGAWRPITPKEAMKVTLNELKDSTNAFYQQIQHALVGAIEAMEGRVPTNGELRQHGHIQTRETEDGERQEIYYWRKLPVLLARFCVREGNQLKHVLEAADPDEFPPLP